jgi:hypothetical protein
MLTIGIKSAVRTCNEVLVSENTSLDYLLRFRKRLVISRGQAGGSAATFQWSLSDERPANRREETPGY